jgi:hypothetical protein
MSKTAAPCILRGTSVANQCPYDLISQMETAGFVLVMLAVWAILVSDRPEAAIRTSPTDRVVRMAGSNSPKLMLELWPSILVFTVALMLAIISAV